MPFSQEVIGRLDNYVYRLIDPRNGQTFYVGRGTGNRVFDHANDRLDLDGDESLKLKTIRGIQASNFEVIHIIHRHGLTEDCAREVEAALIDAYQGITNIKGGEGANQRGMMNADQIQLMYAAEEAVFEHNLLLVCITRTYEERGIEGATKCCWPVNFDRANRCDYVLAVINTIIVEVYEVSEWVLVNERRAPNERRRYEFEGTIAQPDIKNRYINKRIPDEYRLYGGSVRYHLNDEM